MRDLLRPALIAAIVALPAMAALPAVALAQGTRTPRAAPPIEQPATLGYMFGLTPRLPLGYDTDGDNDRNPALAPSQQGGGQQTGGPARNLIPGDRLHFVPR